MTCMWQILRDQLPIINLLPMVLAGHGLPLLFLQSLLIHSKVDFSFFLLPIIMKKTLVKKGLRKHENFWMMQEYTFLGIQIINRDLSLLPVPTMGLRLDLLGITNW